MAKNRRTFTPEQKAKILKEHLFDGNLFQIYAMLTKCRRYNFINGKNSSFNRYAWHLFDQAKTRPSSLLFRGLIRLPAVFDDRLKLGDGAAVALFFFLY